MTKDINFFKNRVYLISKFVFLFWVFCLAIIVVGGIGILISGQVSFKNFNIESLNHIGGFFNIVTSLASVATVFLLATAVILQKKELKEISSSMNEQILLSKKVEITNRTFRYIDEWKQTMPFSIERNTLDSYEDGRVKYITMLRDLSSAYNDINQYIDLKTISIVIKNDNFINELESTLKIREANKPKNLDNAHHISDKKDLIFYVFEVHEMRDLLSFLKAHL